jgi:transposase
MSEQDASGQAAARSPRLLRPDRLQLDPNPLRIDDLIPLDHPVRLIWRMVQEIDVGPLCAGIKAVDGRPGHPAIDPQILIALWSYATIEGISSARELERRCYDCDPFKWLRGGVDVNHHTLSDFRTAHGRWLKQQVVATVAAMRAEGLVDLNQVGQDGLRVRASAGSGSFKREETLNARYEEAQQQWERLQDEFEDRASQRTPKQQAAEERAARERLERLRRAKEEVQKVQQAKEQRQAGDGKRARASTTDPEARCMKMPDNGFRPAYNVQFATTLDTLVIVGVDVTNVGSDGGQMAPMVTQIETQQGAVPGEYYTDGGFSTKEDIVQLETQNIVVFTPVKEAAKQQREGKDPYAQRAGEGAHLTAWRQRMGTTEGKEKYKVRSKCEWSNAQCRNHGLYQFLVRGLEKVKAIACWHALAHNLLRWAALRAQRAATTQ